MAGVMWEWKSGGTNDQDPLFPIEPGARDPVSQSMAGDSSFWIDDGELVVVDEDFTLFATRELEQ